VVTAVWASLMLTNTSPVLSEKPIRVKDIWNDTPAFAVAGMARLPITAAFTPGTVCRSKMVLTSVAAMANTL